MTDIIQLKTARYKGVEMPFEAMSTAGGNRIVRFNFPGSDKQSVEVQGKAPREFTLDFWIPHENYYQERDAFLAVLEDGELGVLTHPTFGDVENVINGKYTLTETISELGRARVSVPFFIDDAGEGIPIQSANLPAQVATDTAALNEQLGLDFEFYGVTISFSGNFTDAAESMGAAIAAIAEAASLFDPSPEDAAEFTQQVNVLANNIGSLVESPPAFSTGVSVLFESLNNLFDSPELTLAVFESLFEFGSDDPSVVQNTVGRKERKINRDILRTQMAAQALSFAYLSSSQIEFQTDDEITEVQDRLEVQYLAIKTGNIISNETTSTRLPDDQSQPNAYLLSNESFEQLDRLRTQAQLVFDGAQVNTNTIITVNTPLRPLSVLVFAYYGSTELVETIAELNDVKQNAFVDGDIRILSA